MGLYSEFEEATLWVQKDLSFGKSNTFTSFFEVNIRILGGLLSAYELSNNTIFLTKATELGDIMTEGFYNNLPYTYYNFKTHEGRSRKELRFFTNYGPIYGKGYFSLAEIGTLQVELTALSYHTKDPKYESLGSKITKNLHNFYQSGLIPNGIYTDGSDTGVFSVAGEADSYYEYLLKEFLHRGAKDLRLKEVTTLAINEIIEKLVSQDVSGLYFLGIIKNGVFFSQMDHLACFFPGMIVLAISKLELKNSERLMIIAKELAYTCYLMYEQSKSGLASETVYVNYGIKYP